MNPSMMATRNALPLSNPATLMHIREKTADTETTTSTADVAFLKSRDSTGARLSRKMEKLFSSRKAERRQNAVDLPAKKSAFYRQFVEARAFVNTGLQPAMDAINNQSPATPTVKPGLSVESATGTRCANAKLDQKVSIAMLSSKQDGGDGSSEETSAMKEALAKQFVSSRATMAMAKPSIFRR
ncbi:hypothetical protein JG687_00010257 [Phytophthora cactorum]|uniref:Uncharacterized protein n=1 Tax=Phytophthora cactorum TaxID=29920 RepID=A0A8T1U7N6_9STRA|nr:hypothetical protein JG687_00010257 [Phytophthora cactorum]